MLTSASLGTDKTDFFFSAALKKNVVRENKIVWVS